MAEQEDDGRLHRKRRRLARDDHELEEDVRAPDNSLPQPYGFLHLLSLVLEYEIPILFPGSERPRNAYGLLGSGTSFLVFKEERSMDSLPIYHGKRRSLEDRMVLKRTRQFTDMESSKDSVSNARYKSVISEMQILLDPFVQEHEYIIDLHGLTWDYEPGDDNEAAVTVWPVLALEAAESSMQALKTEFDLSKAPLYARLEYCYHVAKGLEFLHSRGVVHCDMKLENVLICVTERSGSVAKICDFGSAILGVNEESHFPYGLAGTPPWTSPEFRRSLQGLDIFKTDVYSFGMLLWRFLSITSSLTNLETLANRDLKDRIERLDELKNSDKIADIAVQELRSIEEETITMDIVFKILRHTLVFDPTQRYSMEVVSSLLSQAIGTALKSCSSSASPESQEDDPPDESPGTSFSEDVPGKILPASVEPFFAEFERAYEIWEDESPVVKRHIIKCLKECASIDGVPTVTAAEAAYQLMLCHVNGYGVEKSLATAQEWMIQAARSGNLKAQAEAYALFKGVSPVEDLSPQLKRESINWLRIATEKGSASAAQSLQILDPELCKTGLDSWGKRFFDLKQILKLNHCLETESDTSVSFLHQMASGMVLDERGNRCLHYAAMSGNLDLLKFLRQENADMNSTNAKGESALLCACRSNQPQIVTFFLDIGADITPATSGESPLHWLIAIEEKHVMAIASKLVEGGADVEQQYQRTEDNDLVFDIYPLGTPLDWAVSKRRLKLIATLIELGADPFNECSQYSPFTRSASAHDWEVLHILLKSQYATPDKMNELQSTGNGVLFEAIYCYPPYNRILLHGRELRSAAVKTVKCLTDAGCQSSCLDRNGSTMLHILAGFCDLEFMEWFFDDFDLVQYINTRVGESNRTPIHNAIPARNHEVFEFLLSKGADVSGRVEDLTILHILALMKDQDFTVKCLDSMQLHGRQDLDSFAKIPPILENFPEGVTAFELAVYSANLRVASTLLHAGALPCTNKDRDLHFVAILITLPSWTSIESLRYYLEKVECPIIVRKSTSLSILHIAASAMQQLSDVVTGEQKLDILLRMFSHPTQVNARTTSSNEPGVAAGQTPLHYAAKFAVFYAVQRLLLAGADAGAKDDSGHTPLDLVQMQISSFKAKMLDQQHPQTYVELQSTARILEQATDLTAVEAARPQKAFTGIRTHLSMLGFEIEATKS